MSDIRSWLPGAFGAMAAMAMSLLAAPLWANSALDACLLEALRDAAPTATVESVREQCEAPEAVAEDSGEAALDDRSSGSLILERIQREQRAEQTRSILIPHRRNYLIPVSYNRTPNNEPFRDLAGELAIPDELDRFESTFQVSLKFTLADQLLLDSDELMFGFTAKSFWQVYNKDASAPFRETNYEPELFWAAPLEWRPFGTDASFLVVGFSHQSNGRGGSLSRSGNRLYANFILERNRFVFSLKPWWRIPEDPKDDPLDAEGDDNPDIGDFMGNFEFTTLYRRHDHEFGLMLRNNLRSDNKGAVRLDWTFPLWRNVRGYAQYFNGYGESLIDYDARTERLGVGILLTDLL